MKPTETLRFRVSPGAKGQLPTDIAGNAWSAFLEHARSCDADAYEDLYQRLKCFRSCFTRHIFVDPEGTYREFVRDLVDQVRYGFLPDSQSLFAQARISAMRQAADRIQCLTMAARVLSTIPKRHREVLIRAQLAHDDHQVRVRPAVVPNRPQLATRPISTARRKSTVLVTYRGRYTTPAAVA